MDRLVLWQFEILVADISDRFNLDDTSARLVALDHIDEMVSSLERQLSYVWRRHLAALLGRTESKIAKGVNSYFAAFREDKFTVDSAFVIHLFVVFQDWINFDFSFSFQRGQTSVYSVHNRPDEGGVGRLQHRLVDAALGGR